MACFPSLELVEDMVKARSRFLDCSRACAREGDRTICVATTPGMSRTLSSSS